jgi:hypothetical protein
VSYIRPFLQPPRRVRHRVLPTSYWPIVSLQSFCYSTTSNPLYCKQSHLPHSTTLPVPSSPSRNKRPGTILVTIRARGLAFRSFLHRTAVRRVFKE